MSNFWSTPGESDFVHALGSKNVSAKLPGQDSLLACSLLISEDFLFSVDFPGDGSVFSTFVRGYKKTAIAEKRQENPEILTN